MTQNNENKAEQESIPLKPPTCFVIMPISNPKEYEDKHFDKIYSQIFIPAITTAGFYPKRADDNRSSHEIHIDIIKELIEAPLVLCDLSTRNPNVLYELGIRHAFDKPVVLVQEEGTERIFDTIGINTTNYRSKRLFDEVIEDQKNICQAIKETSGDENNINSMIKMVKMESAKIGSYEISGDVKSEMILNKIMSEIRGLRNDIAPIKNENEFNDSNNDIMSIFNRKIVNKKDNKLIPEELAYELANLKLKLSMLESDLCKLTENEYNEKKDKYMDEFNKLAISIEINKSWLPTNTYLELKERLQGCNEILKNFNM